METALFPTAAARYGGALANPATSTASTAATPLPQVAGPSGIDLSPAWHPDSPMFWLGAILAVAVGLAYASTTVRVGPVKASASAGKS
jgi:hypothetical protein